MRQFGGSGKGWLVESFFPTPDELTAVFHALQPTLLVTNTRVSASYTSTPIDEWLRAYRRYANRAVSGKPVTWRLSSPLYISLAVPGIRVKETPVHGKPFKLLEPAQPVIHCSPQLLYYERGKLSLAIFNLDDSAVFGLTLTLPRLASRSPATAVQRGASAPRSSYQLFQLLCEELRQRSRPCVFEARGKSFRPRLYISQSWGEEINRHAYLQQCGLHVR